MDREHRRTLESRVAPFTEAVGVDETPIDELALLISQALNPTLDVIGAMADLDELAARCPSPTRQGVMDHLFGGGGDAMFRGDTGDYHHWRNSCVDQVVARRRGMPITLSIVAIAVARRVGVELVGVGMPGHFLVGDPDDAEWFADPFGGNVDLDRDGCRRLAMSMGQTRWHDAFLSPTPNRLIAARVLNNLRASCEHRNDVVRFAIVMQLRQALPEFSSEADEAAHALAVFN